MAQAIQTASRATLPVSYQRAKDALQKCYRIDECKDWSDKARALASYAKQADDKTLFQTAVKINGRAVRRMGELIDKIERAKNQHDARLRAKGGAPPSRSEVARAAGVSADQQKQALRVAAIPKRDFEKAIEAQQPPTLTALANQGKKPRPKQPSVAHLEGRDPLEYNAAIHLRGAMGRFVEQCAGVTPSAAVRGTLDRDYTEMRAWAKKIVRWTERVQKELEKKR